MVVRPEETNSTYYNLDHQDGRVAAIPENLCMFPNLVILNLANNFIDQLENISCILELNQLNVQNNRITSLESNTFSTMEHLRILDISYNRMQIIEPDTFLTSDGLIYSVSANQQTLKEVDVTNIFGYGLFCLRNLSHVSLDMVNKNNFSVSAGNSSIIGPGTINIHSLNNQPVYNFTDSGLDFRDFTRQMKASIEYDSSSFYCDCSIVPLLKEVGVPSILTFWPALLDGITCSSPDNLKGLVLDQYFKTETLDRLTCNLIEYCPWKCNCTDLQTQEKVLVNCTGAGLTSLPDYMPTGYWNNRDLEVLLDGNRINTVETREWLERTCIISLARNPFDKINTAEINYLPDDAEIDLSELVLKSLPRSIQKKDLNKISFNGTSVVCDCTNTWIGDWIRSYRANKKLRCNVNGHFIFAEHVSSSSLDCTDEEHVSPFVLLGTLISGLVVVILASLLLHYFRFKIMIIKRRLTRSKKTETCPFLYKVFISFDTNDDWVFNWVIRDTEHKHFHETISERLNKERCAYFIPYTDILPGENVEEVTSLKAGQCETFVIVFSEDYLQNETCRLEFDTIWKQYWAHQDKKIILIEFDRSNKTSATLDRRLEALLRASNPLRFEARNDRVTDRLLHRLRETRPLTLQAQSVRTISRDEPAQCERGRSRITLEEIELHSEIVIPDIVESEVNCKVGKLEDILKNNPPSNKPVKDKRENNFRPSVYSPFRFQIPGSILSPGNEDFGLKEANERYHMYSTVPANMRHSNTMQIKKKKIPTQCISKEPKYFEQGYVKEF